jgi:hypothetical protein
VCRRRIALGGQQAAEAVEGARFQLAARQVPEDRQA